MVSLLTTYLTASSEFSAILRVRDKKRILSEEVDRKVRLKLRVRHK
uniref:Uncharacterized protein n=1 Tax=Manihot esculenta TaxID=3983 RepID=A0A2C9V4X5_MANES